MHASVAQTSRGWMASREQYTGNLSDSMNVRRWNSAGPIVYLSSVTRESRRPDQRECDSWFEFARRARDRWLTENPY